MCSDPLPDCLFHVYNHLIDILKELMFNVKLAPPERLSLTEKRKEIGKYKTA
jgi:hypothetical protein